MNPEERRVLRQIQTVDPCDFIPYNHTLKGNIMRKLFPCDRRNYLSRNRKFRIIS